MMTSYNIKTQLMPKEWVNWKPYLITNDGKFYKIEYISEEKDKQNLEIEEVTKIEETDISFKIHFSSSQMNILNNGGSIIIKKGTFPVDAKVTQIKDQVYGDGSTENLGNKNLCKVKGAERSHSEARSEYKQKLRSSSSKSKRNELIKKDHKPKLQIMNDHNIPGQGDEITKNINGNISQEVLMVDHREEAANKVCNLMKLDFSSIPEEKKREIVKLTNLYEPTDQIFNNLNVLSPELVYFILNGGSKTTSLEKETSIPDTKIEEMVKLKNVCEPTNQLVNNLNVSSQELVGRSNTNILATETSTPDTKNREIVKSVNLCEPTNQIVNSLNVSSLELVGRSNTNILATETSTPDTKNREIVKSVNLCEPTNQIVNSLNVSSLELVGRSNTNILATETSTPDTKNREIVKSVNLCEPTNQIVNSLNVSSLELVGRSNTNILATETSTPDTKNREIVKSVNLCEPTNQIVNSLNVSSLELVNDPQSMIEQMDYEGLEENEKITEDVTSETDVIVIVENNPTDPNNPRKWKQEVTTICKITTITKIKEIYT